MSTTNDSLAVAVDVKDLARAMRDVASVAGKEPTTAGTRRCYIPVLQNVLVEALPGRLRLTCTDLEECRVREIPALVVGQGAVTVPARLLKDLAKELKRGQVELRHEHQPSLPLTQGTSVSTKGGYAYKFAPAAVPPADVLMVHYRPLNLVSRFKAIEAAEFPPLYRDIDLGDWGFMAPVALEVAA